MRYAARFATLATLLFVIAGCNGSDSEAQSGCSVATLRGAYIYAQDGFIVAGETPAERVPFAQAGREIFAGDGTMSGMATANVNGAVARVTYAGTYTVAPDCTGAVTFTDGDGVVSHYDIAIEDGGGALGFVQTDPNVVTAAFERRRAASQAPCALTTLRGAYVYAGDGFDLAGAGSTQRTPFATAGREVYGGDGTLSGIDTTSANGVAARTTYTSTYTVDPDCTGTYAYDTDPDNPYELFIASDGAEFAYVATSATRVAAGYERRR